MENTKNTTPQGNEQKNVNTGANKTGFNNNQGKDPKRELEKETPWKNPDPTSPEKKRTNDPYADRNEPSNVKRNESSAVNKSNGHSDSASKMTYPEIEDGGDMRSHGMENPPR